MSYEYILPNNGISLTGIKASCAGNLYILLLNGSKIILGPIDSATQFLSDIHYTCLPVYYSVVSNPRFDRESIITAGCIILHIFMLSDFKTRPLEILNQMSKTLKPKPQIQIPTNTKTINIHN